LADLDFGDFFELLLTAVFGAVERRWPLPKMFSQPSEYRFVAPTRVTLMFV
jgi:hypothetical protein